MKVIFLYFFITIFSYSINIDVDNIYHDNDKLHLKASILKFKPNKNKKLSEEIKQVNRSIYSDYNKVRKLVINSAINTELTSQKLPFTLDYNYIFLGNDKLPLISFLVKTTYFIGKNKMVIYKGYVIDHEHCYTIGSLFKDPTKAKKYILNKIGKTFIRNVNFNELTFFFRKNNLVFKFKNPSFLDKDWEFVFTFKELNTYF